MVLLFLLALATGARGSELHAVLRGDDNLVFSGDGVSLYPNPNFLAKNEDPQNRRNPIFISSLFEESGAPHPLCPVHKLRQYLQATATSSSMKLFLDPVGLSDLSLFKLRHLICLFIRMSDTGAFPKLHDLRKVASSYAFFRTMSLDNICGVTGWSSCRVFKRHYMTQLQEGGSSFVALGTSVPSREQAS